MKPMSRHLSSTISNKVIRPDLTGHYYDSILDNNSFCIYVGMTHGQESVIPQEYLHRQLVTIAV